VLFFVIRPLMRRFQKLTAEAAQAKLPAPSAGQDALPAGTEDPISSLLLEQPADKYSIRKKSSALVKYNPEKATEIIRAWLKEEA